MKKVCLLSLIILLVGAWPLVALAQDPTTYVNSDGSLTFDLPDGWVVEEASPTEVYIGTNRRTVTQGPSAADDVMVFVLPPPVIDNVMVQFGFDSRIGANITGNLLTTAFASSGFDFQGGGMDVLDDLGDGRQAFVYHGIFNASLPARMIAIDTAPEVVVILIALGGGDNLDAATDNLLLIAQTVTYTPTGTESVFTEVVWQTQSPSSEWADVGAVAVGADDTIYVAGGTVIYVFDPSDGSLSATIEVEGALQLVDVAVAADGSLWAVDDEGGQLLHLSTDGDILETWAGTDALFAPNQLALDLTNEAIYLVNQATDTIQRLDAAVLAGEADPVKFAVNAQREFPRVGLALIEADSEGYVVVVDGLGEVWGFDSDGTYIGSLGVLVRAANTTAFLLDNDGYVYLAVNGGVVYRFGFDGGQAGRFGDYAPAEGEFAPNTYFGIRGLALLSNGDVVVVDANNDTRQIVRVRWLD